MTTAVREKPVNKLPFSVRNVLSAHMHSLQSMF
uniref:Uncharacterized protein n=1 Tax=Anguilla anguilla TaxID=7936 RepID=A0A0E9PDW1_ANGAN